MIDTDPQKHLRLWLKRKLQEKGHGAAAQLADYMKVRRNALSKILKPSFEQGYRAIKADELIKMAEFFGEMPPGLAQTEIQASHSELIALFEQAAPEQQQLILSLLKSLIPAKPKK